MVFLIFLLTRPLRDVTMMLLQQAHQHHRFLLTRPLRDVTTVRDILLRVPGFLLTRPLRDVTGYTLHPGGTCEFLLTRPLRDVTITPFTNPFT